MNSHKAIIKRFRKKFKKNTYMYWGDLESIEDFWLKEVERAYDKGFNYGIKAPDLAEKYKKYVK